MFCSYLNRFSAPDLSMSSLLICMFSFDLLVCSLPRQVAARGSDPCNQKIVKNCIYYQYQLPLGLTACNLTSIFILEIRSNSNKMKRNLLT